MGRAFVAAILSAAIGAAAASTSYTLSVTTSRPEALYRQGEEVVFKVRLLQDRQPVSFAEAQWTISKDGAPPNSRGTLTLNNGAGVVLGKLSEPGFLQCRVSFTSPEGVTRTAVAGAGVDPLKIKPSLPVPRDFDAFWAAQKKRLAAVPINPRLTPVKSREPGVECYDLQADCIGAPVSGYFAKPIGAKPRSLPIILTVQGAGVRTSNRAGTIGWAKEGFLAMDINAHGIPNDQSDQFYADLANGKLKDYPHQGRDSRETVYFLGMFLRLVRAIDFLTAQPEWDGHTVIVHGGSQGGAQSIVAAGLDSRVTFLAAGVPAMCDHTGMVAGRISGWPKRVPVGSDGKPDAKVLEAARYYDAMNFATRTKAGAILTVGFIDPTCPPTSVYAAFNALKGKKQIYNDPFGTHVISSAAMDAMRSAIREHAAQTKKAR